MKFLDVTNIIEPAHFATGSMAYVSASIPPSYLRGPKQRPSMIALLHGEYGLPGFAAAALFIFALVYLFNLLAKSVLKKLKRK